jgi:peptide/nickel transport system permease protein
LATFVVRRLILGIFVIVIVSVVVFLFIQIVPGDPLVAMLGQQATREQLEALRKELWLDRPIIVQYGHWLSNAVRGDLGHSITLHDDVATLIAARLPVSLHLAVLAFIIGNILGIAAGIICAIRRGGIIDSVVTLLANLGIAVPIFLLGMLCIYYFSLKLGWLPVQGYTSPFTDFWRSTKQVILPVLCLSIPAIAVLARQTRSSMLEVVRQDYIRTARSKGLRERLIISKHALKNALIPIVTLMGLNVSVLIGGQVLIETVFNIPGMGRLIAEGAINKDIILVQGCAMLIAMIVVLVNLSVDLTYGWLDPRIRYD